MSYRYRPGISRDRTARKRLIAKFGQRCMECGYEGYVDLHHKKRVADGGDWGEDNLILLCEKCHAKAHGYTKKKYLDPARKSWNEAANNG